MVAAYHGRSFDDLIPAIPGASYSRPTDVMKRMLAMRHLAPIYGGRTPLAPLARDGLIIDPAPDILVTGHAHTFGVDQYNGILLLNASTWQAETEYQRMRNITPVPARAAVVDLTNLAVSTLDFSTRRPRDRGSRREPVPDGPGRGDRPDAPRADRLPIVRRGRPRHSRPFSPPAGGMRAVDGGAVSGTGGRAACGAEDEVLVVFKTVPKRVGALFESPRRTHPYDVPEMIELDVPRVDPPYLRYLAETLDADSPPPPLGGGARPSGVGQDREPGELGALHELERRAPAGDDELERAGDPEAPARRGPSPRPAETWNPGIPARPASTSRVPLGEPWDPPRVPAVRSRRRSSSRPGR